MPCSRSVAIVSATVVSGATITGGLGYSRSSGASMIVSSSAV